MPIRKPSGIATTAASSSPGPRGPASGELQADAFVVGAVVVEGSGQLCADGLPIARASESLTWPAQPWLLPSGLCPSIWRTRSARRHLHRRCGHRRGSHRGDVPDAQQDEQDQHRQQRCLARRELRGSMSDRLGDLEALGVVIRLCRVEDLAHDGELRYAPSGTGMPSCFMVFLASVSRKTCSAICLVVDLALQVAPALELGQDPHRHALPGMGSKSARSGTTFTLPRPSANLPVSTCCSTISGWFRYCAGEMTLAISSRFSACAPSRQQSARRGRAPQRCWGSA